MHPSFVIKHKIGHRIKVILLNGDIHEGFLVKSDIFLNILLERTSSVITGCKINLKSVFIRSSSVGEVVVLEKPASFRNNRGNSHSDKFRESTSRGTKNYSDRGKYSR